MRGKRTKNPHHPSYPIMHTLRDSKRIRVTSTISVRTVVGDIVADMKWPTL